VQVAAATPRPAPCQVCPFSGIVIAGHLGGDVRLYQFTEGAQTVHRMNIDETLLPYENVGTQVWQYNVAVQCGSTLCIMCTAGC
jgi:hypothetical protein